MTFYVVVLVTLLTHTSFKASKVLISLYGLELGANPMALGVLFSMYALFPTLLSVYAGKLSDRYGCRPPMLFGACGLLLGLLLPFIVPRLWMLYVSAGFIGLCYIFYTVSVQHLVGALGEGISRTRNYGLFSLAVALTGLLGPTLAGFAIDSIGHRTAYLTFAFLPAIALIALTFARPLLHEAHPRRDARGDGRVADLLANVPLRRALVTAAIVETGLELFNFYLPIYGHSIGFSASQIGIVMGAFAGAQLFVRVIMPQLVQRSSEEHVLSGSLLLAAGACVFFPFVDTFTSVLVMSFVLGSGLGCGSPLSMVLAYNRSPPGRTGVAIGLRQTANKVTETLMPLIFGSLATLIGMVPVFWLDAVLLGTGGLLMSRDATERRTAATAAARN